jgi:hypothetical protein
MFPKHADSVVSFASTTLIHLVALVISADKSHVLSGLALSNQSTNLPVLENRLRRAKL